MIYYFHQTKKSNWIQKFKKTKPINKILCNLVLYLFSTVDKPKFWYHSCFGSNVDDCGVGVNDFFFCTGHSLNYYFQPVFTFCRVDCLLHTDSKSTKFQHYQGPCGPELELPKTKGLTTPDYSLVHTVHMLRLQQRALRALWPPKYSVSDLN